MEVLTILHQSHSQEEAEAVTIPLDVDKLTDEEETDENHLVMHDQTMHCQTIE